jgi:hypothetical protein
VPNCFKVHLAVQGENITDRDITELVLESDSNILLEWQWYWQWHGWCRRHKCHMMDWQNKLLTYSTYSPQVYRGPSVWWQTELPRIIKNPSPLSVLTTRAGKQAPSTSHLKRHDTRQNRQWLMQCKRIWCHVFSVKNKETTMKFKCQECNIRLCANPYFKVYHTKLHFWGSADTKRKSRTHKCQ